MRNRFQWNFNRYSYIFIQENSFENVVCEMASILSRPQCVYTSLVFQARWSLPTSRQRIPGLQPLATHLLLLSLPIKPQPIWLPRHFRDPTPPCWHRAHRTMAVLCLRIRSPRSQQGSTDCRLRQTVTMCSSLTSVVTSQWTIRIQRNWWCHSPIP